MFVFYLYSCYWVLEGSLTSEHVHLQSWCSSSQFVSSASFYLYILPNGYSQRMRALLKWFRLSDAVRDGAEGFFRAQYSTISKMALLLAVVILCIYLLRSTTPQQESSGLGRSTSACITVAAFLLGALCSGVAGYVGMWVSVRANVRVSSAARRAAREALQLFVLVVFLHWWWLAWL